jgi:hypothetical protein
MCPASYITGVQFLEEAGILLFTVMPSQALRPAPSSIQRVLWDNVARVWGRHSLLFRVGGKNVALIHGDSKMCFISPFILGQLSGNCSAVRPTAGMIFIPFLLHSIL